jgi:dihydroorotate dehydrogenase (NAD+) catalytic subunit
MTRPRTVDLSTSIGPIRLRNPVLLASGTYGGIFDRILDTDRLGGVVLKTVTRRPRRGNPPPRVHETPSGMLNSIGLENKGIERFIRYELPRALEHRCAVIVSVSGEDPADTAQILRRLRPFRKIAGIELNISCPNVSHGLDYGTDPAATAAIVAAARRATAHPLIAKLTPNVTDVRPIAAAAFAAGADAVSLVNTFRAMAVDWRLGRPVLGGVTGGLSGPAIRPIALRMVWEVAGAFPDRPVVGIGGIASAEDALEFIAAGACAVQIGTASFADPQNGVRIVEEMRRLLATERIGRLRDLVGAARTADGRSAPGASGG